MIAGTMLYEITDCCVKMYIDGEPTLILQEGEVDPFIGTEIGWPYPRVYWSTGVVTDGPFEEVIEHDC